METAQPSGSEDGWNVDKLITIKIAWSDHVSEQKHDWGGGRLAEACLRLWWSEQASA